jgi:hypothetical protein
MIVIVEFLANAIVVWAMLTGARPFSGPPLPFCLPVIAARPIVLSIGAESSG